MVLRKIVHHIASAIYRARAYKVDAEKGYHRSGIASKTSKGTKYDNVKWQNTERSKKIHCLG